MKNRLGAFLIQFLATGFGVGYSPLAPGTFGSLVGVGIYYLVSGMSGVSYAIFAVAVGLFSIAVAHAAESVFKVKDCQKIVIDEVAGQLLAYLFVPLTLPNLIIGFILFRFFDIKKIFPANWAQDNLPGGAGVVGDDLVAGLQAAVFLWIIHTLIYLG